MTAGGRGWGAVRAVGWGLAALLAPTVPHLAGQVLIPGQGVSIDLVEDGAGALLATDIEILALPHGLSLRGPIEAVDPADGRVRVLGRWILVSPEVTRVVPERTALALSAFEIGEWVEIRLVDAGAQPWTARRVELYAKRTRTIEGTTGRVVRGPDGTILDVGGIPVKLSRATDVDEEAGGMFAELFGEMKADDMIGDDPGYRQVGHHLFFSGSVRPIARVERGFGLAAGADDIFSVGEPSIRLEGMAVLPEGMRLFAQGQIRSRYELYRSSDAHADDVANAPELQMRQLFLSAPSLAGAPLGVTVGKQRVRDTREFLFDEYLDGIRLYAYPLQPLVLEASFFTPVLPLRERYETWRDLLLQARWFPNDDWRAAVYALRRWDSDPERGRNVRYYGGSLEGEHDALRVWALGALLRGSDKGREQRAWAWDTGLALRARHLALQPGISLSLARGSGETAGGTEFRQSGYHDNSSRVWGLASFNHYGEALDPELTNLEVATASVGIRHGSRTSLDLVAHRYRLVQPTDELDTIGLDVADEPLTGESLDVGHGVDGILAVRDLLPGIHFTYKLGVFLSGHAFVDTADPAWLHKLELRIDF
ncbi:MAG: alginate export family protein [Gemmatimonadota bacterium]